MDMVAEVKHFEQRTEPYPFDIGDPEDVYYAVPDLPGGLLGDLVVRFEDAQKYANNPTKQIEMMLELVEVMLLGDGAERFKARLSNRDKPIGLRALMQIFVYLFEQYGMRPTEPSPDSSDGADDGMSGLPSTENAPAEDSIPEISPSPATSTSSTSTESAD